MADSPNSRAHYAMDFYTRLGYQPHQAAGIVGNLMAESGLNPNVRPGDNGTAFGVAQWRGDRLTGLQRFAASQGKDWRDFDVQLGYVHHELQNNERAAGDRIRAASNAQEANDGMITFERPFGSNKGARYAHNYSGRLNYTNQFLASWQGGNGRAGSDIQASYMPQAQASQGQQAIDGVMTGAAGNGGLPSGGQNGGNAPRYVRKWEGEDAPPNDVIIDPDGRLAHIYGQGGQLEIERQDAELQKQWEELEVKEPGRYKLIPTSELENYQKQWKEQNQSQGILGDTWRLLGSGQSAFEESIDGALRLIPGYKAVSDWASKFLHGETVDERQASLEEHRNARYSDATQEARQKNWIDVDEKTGEWNIGSAWTDWRSWYAGIMESLPSTAASMTPAGWAGKVAYARGLAQGLTKAEAGKRAVMAAHIAGSATEALLVGGASAAEVHKEIASLPREALEKSDAVKALMSEGKSFDEAIELLSADAEKQAFLLGGLAGGIFGGFGDRLLGTIIVEKIGGNFGRRTLRGAGRGIIAEGLLEEMPQEAGQQMAQNIAMQGIDPNRSTWEGVPNAAMGGLAIGGAMGAGMGGTAGAMSPKGPLRSAVEYGAGAANNETMPTIAENATVAPPVVAPPSGLEQDTQVRVVAPDIEPFTGKVVGENAGFVDVMEEATGEVVSVPSQFVQPMPQVTQQQEAVSANARTGNVNQLAVSANARTGNVNQPAVSGVGHEQGMQQSIEGMAAQETRSALPDEQKPVANSPKRPDVGSHVIVDLPNTPRFSARVMGWTEQGALIRRQDGSELVVPRERLYVDGRSETTIAAEDEKLNPPVKREKVKTPLTREAFGKQVVLPDDLHARLYDYGLDVHMSRKLAGKSRLETQERHNPARAKLAQELAVSEQNLDGLADDYRIRTLQAARKASGQLPVHMHKMPQKLLTRYRQDYKKVTAQAEMFSQPQPAETVKPQAEKPKAEKQVAKNVNSLADENQGKHPDAHYAKLWNEAGITARQAILNKVKVVHSPKLDWDKHTRTVRGKIAAVFDNVAAMQEVQQSAAIPKKWDGLDEATRKEVMAQAGVKIPVKMNWDKMSNPIRAKIEKAMLEQPAKLQNKTDNLQNKMQTKTKDEEKKYQQNQTVDATKTEQSHEKIAESVVIKEEKKALTPLQLQMKAVANMRRVIKTRGDVENAVTRPDIGQIDFVWGNEGGAVDAKGKRKGAYGVAHILEARQRKDGLSEQQAAQVAEEVAKVVATGEIKTDNKEIPDSAKTKRIEITNDNHTAVLVQRLDGSKNSWLLTGYELWENKEDSGETGVEYDTTNSTHFKPTRSRLEAGAESTANIVTQGNIEDKNKKGSDEIVRGRDNSDPTHSRPTLARSEMGAEPRTTATQEAEKVKQTPQEQDDRAHYRSILSDLHNAAARADNLGGEMPSDKQMSYLASLLSKAGLDASDLGLTAGNGILTKRDASTAIEYYLGGKDKPRTQKGQERKKDGKKRDVKIGLFQDLTGNGFYLGGKQGKQIARLKVGFKSKREAADYLREHQGELQEQPEVLFNREEVKDNTPAHQAEAAGEERVEMYSIKGEDARERKTGKVSLSIGEGKSIVPVKPLRQASNFSEAREAAKEFQGKVLTNARSGLKAVASRNSLDKMLSGRAVQKSVSPASHSLAVANVDKLFERAIYGWSKEDEKNQGGIVAIHRLFAPLSLQDGRILFTKMTVKETVRLEQKNSLYTVEAVEINERSSALEWVESEITADKPALMSTLNNNLAQSSTKSNIESVMKLADAIEAHNQKLIGQESGRSTTDTTMDTVGSKEVGNRHSSTSNSTVAQKIADFYNKDETTKSKYTPETLKTEVLSGDLGKYIERLIDAGKVRIIESKDSGAPDGVQGWTSDNGTITLVADSIAHGDAQAVLLHEMFHSGVKPIMGEQFWQKLMGQLDSLYRQFENPAHKGANQFFQEAHARVDLAKAKQGGMSDTLAAEEFAAYAVEEYERAPQAIKSWVAKLLDQLRAWVLRQFGKQFGQVTPAQLRALAVAALKAQAQETGGRYPVTSSQRYSINQAKNKISALIEETPKLDVGTTKTVEIGAVSKKLAATVFDETGLDIEGFNHSIDASSILHIRKRHGDMKKEAKSGQIAVSNEDLLRIPEIINDPDYIVLGMKNVRGQDTIAYVKHFPNDNTTFYLEEVRTGKERLAAVTMRKHPAATDSASIARSAPSHAQSDSRAKIKIIPFGGKSSGGRKYSIASEARERVAQVTPARVVQELRGKWTDWKPHLLKAVPLNYFGELKRPTMTAVDEYLKTKRELDAYRGKKHADADKIAQKWLKLGKTGKQNIKNLADLMHLSTLKGIDPSKTDAETKAKSGYDELRRQYNQLPPMAQELYNEVRDSYKAQAKELDEIILENVAKAQAIAQEKLEADFEREKQAIEKKDGDPAFTRAEIEKLEKAYNNKRQRGTWGLQARLLRLRQAFEASRVNEPYFPLARFGKYFVSVKDKNGEVISFSRREKAADRDRLVAEMRRAYPDAAIEVGVLEQGKAARDAMDPRMIAEIEAILGGKALEGDVSSTIMDEIWQRYLMLMPDQSIRKNFIHRKGTAGFDADALRAFSHHMFHAAHQMGRLKYAMELQNQVNKTAEQAKVTDDPTRGMMLANELRARHEWVMNPTGSKFAQTMNSTAFVWYLAATPAAAIVNMTQTPMMGIPILGARLGGMGKASVALMKASKETVSGRGHIINSPNLTKQEREAVESFYETGLIDRTQSHDLAGVGETGVEYSPLRAKWMGRISWMFHNAEVWNREVTALAAYRMAREQGQSHEQAIDTAHDLTWKTHFDYSNSSRARILQGDFAKVAMVFRSHSINMMYRISRDVTQALKGETAQARKEARYQLAGIFGMMAAFGGTTGLFGFNTIMSLLGLIFGDEDDPFDFERRFRDYVVEAIGPQLGGLVLNGVPGHYLGVDLVNRIGMADIWFRSPTRDLQGKDEFQYYVMNALGASVSMVGDALRGLQLASDGNWQRGLEAVAPKAVKDSLKSWRYFNEGLADLRGNEILPRGEIDGVNILGQIIGFTPAKIVETYERNNALKNAEKRLIDRRRAAINRYALAVTQGDDEGKRAAMEAIKRFNASPYHAAIRITNETLRLSLKQRQKLAAKREDGVLIQNQALGLGLRRQLAATVYR